VEREVGAKVAHRLGEDLPRGGDQVAPFISRKEQDHVDESRENPAHDRQEVPVAPEP